MTPKEQLREKFVDILLGDFPQRTAETYADSLMAAVEQAFNQPCIVTIKPTEDELAKLRSAFEAPGAVWIYGDPNISVSYGCPNCGPTATQEQQFQPQQYEGT